MHPISSAHGWAMGCLFVRLFREMDRPFTVSHCAKCNSHTLFGEQSNPQSANMLQNWQNLNLLGKCNIVIDGQLSTAFMLMPMSAANGLWKHIMNICFWKVAAISSRCNISRWLRSLIGEIWREIMFIIAIICNSDIIYILIINELAGTIFIKNILKFQEIATYHRLADLGLFLAMDD